jgi:methyl-accepting chemotaxis protein
MGNTKDLSTKGKLFIAPLLVGCAFLIFGCDFTESNPIKIENQVVSNTGSRGEKAAVAVFLQEKKDEVNKLSKQLAGYMTGKLFISAAKVTLPNGVQVPTMFAGSKILNNNHSFPEKLSAENPGAVATIFVRSGDEFVRISTSLRKSAGEGTTPSSEDRAVGSLLSHEHPAYNAALSGNTYSGTVTLFDVIYMAEYVPMKDANGATIGIMFTGTDITGDIALLRRKLQQLKI